MSCMTYMCRNRLCEWFGFKETECCPQCGGAIYEAWDE